MTNSLLCLIRHGESLWNKENVFTGWEDVNLTENGKCDVLKAASRISDLKFDVAFTSVLIRAIYSLRIILEHLNLEIPVHQSDRLNERHYGDLQGYSKKYIIEKYGINKVHEWRRGFDVKPKGSGESLKDCTKRTIPYLRSQIFPHLLEGKNVLIVAHGNSLRSIIMYLEKLTTEEITNLNLELSTPYLYYFNSNLKIIRKEIRDIDGASHQIF